MKKRKITLKQGEYVRVLGRVTIYSPSGKTNTGWYGGSCWTVKNPLIRLGKCKHKPRKITFVKNFLSFNKDDKKRVYVKRRIVCSECGYIIKFEQE